MGLEGGRLPFEEGTALDVVIFAPKEDSSFFILESMEGSTFLGGSLTLDI